MVKDRAQILLLVRTRRYGESLAALLGTLEGVELAVNGLPVGQVSATGEGVPPTLLLAEDGALLEPARRLWPGCRTVLLVEGGRKRQGVAGEGRRGFEADMTLPRDVSARRLLATVRELIPGKRVER